MVTNTFNDDIITYDEIGNPLTIGNSVLTWINGRQLCSYSDQLNTINYNYNESGIRNKKVVNNVITEYSLSGSEIVFENRAGNMLYYLRNAVDGLVGFMYNNTKYYYIKNKQNDIIGIMDDSFNIIAKYEYDSWGNIISVVDSNDNDVSINYNHIANINPYRYRSYYCDIETKYYYLNNRYYNPEWGRFINIDSYAGEIGGHVFAHNLYIYGLNNPMNYYDDSDEFFALLAAAVEAFSSVYVQELFLVAAVAILGQSIGAFSSLTGSLSTPYVPSKSTATTKSKSKSAFKSKAKATITTAVQTKTEALVQQAPKTISKACKEAYRDKSLNIIQTRDRDLTIVETQNKVSYGKSVICINLQSAEMVASRWPKTAYYHDAHNGGAEGYYPHYHPWRSSEGKEHVHIWFFPS